MCSGGNVYMSINCCVYVSRGSMNCCVKVAVCIRGT